MSGFSARPAERGTAALLCLVLLGGRVTLPDAGLPDLGSWPERRQALTAMADWGFSGRVAVSGRDDGFNGNLHWQQRRDYFDVRVSGPLGAGTVRISGDSDGMTVVDGDGQVRRLDDAERDLERLYGWRIPVASLRYWALGVPDPDLPATTEVADDRLRALRQAGWNVRFGEYRDTGGQAMPRRLTAERDDARVRLVIDRWTFY
ncbi:MAG: lipoprotein insertase outer membrane protein LolB [Woeseiaceae bacterium]|nr:lipoprotein insertase outer membrane protein LolB [Woeseiaceae bacterium]